VTQEERDISVRFTERSSIYSQSFYFIVEAQWTSRPKDASLDVNTSLTWKCEAQGVPPIKYTWLHNGVNMKESADPRRYIIDEGTLSFPMRQVSQKGMYQCHASNSVKELITAAQLDVKGMYGMMFWVGLG
jgi:hypothetical protein